LARLSHHIKGILNEVDVTAFDSYTDFLTGVYEKAKDQIQNYSYAEFSLDLGLGSTNAYGVVRGTRKLSEKIARRIAEHIGLNQTKTKYFVALVKRVNARSAEDKEKAFQEQLVMAHQSIKSDEQKRQLLFFEHWYHAAILELMRLPEAKDDPKWISSVLQPSVSVPKVKGSLELLQALGYLQFDRSLLRLVPSEKLISTGDQVERLAVMSFHRQMLELAAAAMDEIDQDDRDIAAVTLTVSKELMEQLKQDLIALRKKFLAQSQAEKAPTELVQVNLQIFPLKKNVKGEP
jgi:uncharacterized protein (TIGR02147 family)